MTHTRRSLTIATPARDTSRFRVILIVIVIIGVQASMDQLLTEYFMDIVVDGITGPWFCDSHPDVLDCPDKVHWSLIIIMTMMCLVLFLVVLKEYHCWPMIDDCDAIEGERDHPRGFANLGGRDVHHLGQWGGRIIIIIITIISNDHLIYRLSPHHHQFTTITTITTITTLEKVCNAAVTNTCPANPPPPHDKVSWF